MSRIIEAGHYYLAKGPTDWSRMGSQIMERIKLPSDKTMIFIDDIHPLKDMSQSEIKLPPISFNHNFDYLIMESNVLEEARCVLEVLKKLPKRSRCRTNGNSRWFCSGFPVTDEQGFPNCVLLDTGLTLRKQSLGFAKGINILPYFYEEQQRKLLRIVKKAIPAFLLEVILYNLDGSFWRMQ